MNRPRAKRWVMPAMLLAYATVPAKAQLGGVLTASPLDTIGQVGETIGDVTDTPLQPLAAARRDVRKLARDRLRRLALHVSENREAVEWDDHRQPAVRGEVLLLDPDPEALQIAGKAGYPVLERNSIAGLGVPFVRLGVPAGRSLAHAIRELRKALPGRTISADNLHFPAGRVGASVTRKRSPGALPRGGTVGVIDGGIGSACGAARLCPGRPEEQRTCIGNCLAAGRCWHCTHLWSGCLRERSGRWQRPGYRQGARLDGAAGSSGGVDQSGRAGQPAAGAHDSCSSEKRHRGGCGSRQRWCGGPAGLSGLLSWGYRRNGGRRSQSGTDRSRSRQASRLCCARRRHVCARPRQGQDRTAWNLLCCSSRSLAHSRAARIIAQRCKSA